MAWNMYSSGYDDRSFFQRFQASSEEIKRLKAQCRAASEAFGPQRKEDHVSLDHVRKSVTAAQETAKYSLDVLKPEDDGDPGRFQAASKAWLGHLYVPSVGDRYRGDSQDLALPGCTENVTLPPTKEENERGLEDGEFTSLGGTVSPAGAKQGGNPFADDRDLDADIGGMLDSDDDSNADDLDANSQRGDQRRGSGAPSDGRGGDSAAETPESQSQKWRAKPPTLRFKNRLQFSGRFLPSANKGMFEDANADLEESVLAVLEDIKDPMIGWVNTVFAMSIETEYQFEIGFPLIVLTVLDAIYPKRVRWHKVDWRIQYKRALQNNYQVLEKIWSEVNMEKSREFRFEQTSIRLEHMSRANMAQKLEFVRLLKRWFDQRIHHAGPYDPIKNRREFVEFCRLRGLPVTFPPWMKACRSTSPTVRKQSTQMGLYRAMPEYKRFIWFLGSPEHQTM
eukprot:gnl/MRDRNA2_/MRDRNA2_99693_c0_seq1.p1 gnl/MRDRNA2_/MRDRNA2_99693_c0~~gnl/MRDRNA2_/MRDRNA2_99693_c0_seq1.p1  ORF type:complete len:451 (+),score=80.94 gnl/MRDRNA2_/MRDRNA2_99693_c0_seq1:67-1419(+)